MKQDDIFQKIDSASHVIGKTWPLYAFVTSNPLAGFENKHFLEATSEAEQLSGVQVFPNSSSYRNAWENGAIDENELTTIFKKHGLELSIEESLLKMKSQLVESKNHYHEVDKLVVKWLMAFMDEGLSEWSMPNKEKGFYKAWKSLARYDQEFPLKSSISLPDDSIDALNDLLKNYSSEEQITIFEQHLSALPGWAGYIKYRVDTNSEWQKKFSITLVDYLAVRLCITKNLGLDLVFVETKNRNLSHERQLQYLWLKAWEKSWQKKIIAKLAETSKSIPSNSSNIAASMKPEAQMVFCIDTRSELIRRHIESKGNYETFGYAGFFGLAMDYTNFGDGLVKKSCPPILASSFLVSEHPQENKHQEINQFHKRQDRKIFTHYFLKRMKHMLPSAFGYVEGSGLLYGAILLLRTIIPGRLYQPNKQEEISFERICNPQINAIQDANSMAEISLEDKTAIVKSAFSLMGWKNFSPLVLFVGHGSHSANNPFGSSLDCGACAASPGRHNARMLAKLANQAEVREALKSFDIEIPNTTFFLGAEHNTTTDEIVIFDSNVPDSHKNHLSKLKEHLFLAQVSATTERLGSSNDSIKAAQIKTNDWSETRPEWGLAKNAGFIIGPRNLTKDLHLDGNCFLHSYDWETDTDGSALEGIMQGPMVVTQWINIHYYFSTVDNENFGGGSKITHNVTGRFGVIQGNGGDLKRGLPLQSVNDSDNNYYHQPLRLTVFIHAPKERITYLLEKHELLKSLIVNEWIYLMIIDPKDHNNIKAYEENKPYQKLERFLEEALV